MPEWMRELYTAALVFNVPVEKLRFYRRSDGSWTIMTVNGHQGNVQMFVDLMQSPEWWYDHDRFEQALSSKRVDRLHEWLATDKYRH